MIPQETFKRYEKKYLLNEAQMQEYNISNDTGHCNLNIIDFTISKTDISPDSDLWNRISRKG